MQDVTKCFSPILSHTMILVVQWPKFGHSATLNNKSYGTVQKKLNGNLLCLFSVNIYIYIYILILEVLLYFVGGTDPGRRQMVPCLLYF